MVIKLCCTLVCRLGLKADRSFDCAFFVGRQGFTGSYLSSWPFLRKCSKIDGRGLHFADRSTHYFDKGVIGAMPWARLEWTVIIGPMMLLKYSD